jgi:protein phosphatase
MQILHWLYQMTQLWHALEPWQKQQSLLELDNLRVDDDHTLCLKQLCSNQPNETPTLQDLGNLWRQLFAESQKTQVDAIMQLLVDLEAGKLRHSEEITNRLEAIANELEPPTVDPESTLEELAELAIEQITPMTSPPASADISASVAPTRLEVPADLLADDLDSSEGDDMPTVVLPMQLFALEEIGRTDIGRQRDHNEDYFGIETQVQKLESPSGKTLHARNLYILCDGMGGHASGEVASALAVDTIRKFFKERWQEAAFTSTSLPDLETMNQAVQLANKAIFDVNQQNARSGSGRMGTTLVMLVIQDTEAVVAHVGDSRLYRYTRKRGLEQITVDHEVGQREIQRGVDPETAYARPDAYQLTQALGPRDEHFVKPEVQYFELNEDMLLLLCSDGLSDNNLLETNWETHISPLLSSQTNLDKGVSQLIEMANRFNGHDNITAIAIRAKVRPSLDHLR